MHTRDADGRLLSPLYRRHLPVRSSNLWKGTRKACLSLLYSTLNGPVVLFRAFRSASRSINVRSISWVSVNSVASESMAFCRFAN